MNCKMSKNQILALRITGIVCLITLIGGIIFACTFDEYNGVRVGMTQKEYHKIIPENRRITFGYVSFYKNSLGDSVIVRFRVPKEGPELTIADLRCYPAPGRVTESDMKSIKGRVLIDDVVKKLGIPTYNPPSGMRYMIFDTSYGTAYSTLYTDDYISEKQYFDMFIYDSLDKRSDDDWIAGKKFR